MYLIARVFLQPFFLVYFRSRAEAASTPASRAALIVASNHRSFLDPFVIGACMPWRRPMNYVAKVELFEKRWQGWILCRVGAFPIRRGESDEEAMETARMVLERGGDHLHLPRGHPDPQRLARRRPGAASAAWRCRPAPRCSRPPCSGTEHVRRGGASARRRSSSGWARR